MARVNWLHPRGDRAVDDEVGAAHERRRRAGEEGNAGRDLLRRAHAAHRIARRGATLQVERLGFSTSTAAIVTAVVTIVNVAGNLAARWMLQRRVPRVAIIVGATVSMAVCAAGIFLDGVPDLHGLCWPGSIPP